MDQRFRVCSLDQPFLLPPSIQDWLPEEHLARFIGDVSEELDLSKIYKHYERKDNRGMAAYHPLLMTRLLLYGYCIGNTSSRKIERATYEDIGFRYLAADQHPDHDTVAAFRQQHLEALASIFVQALNLCQKAGMVKLGNVSIDGTKLMANASKAQTMSHSKLTRKEQYWKETVDRLLAEAQKTDEQEDERWGKGKLDNPLPPELAKAQSRLERIRQAKADLEKEAQQALEVAQQEYEPRKQGRPTKEVPKLSPEERRKRNRDRHRLTRAKQNASNPEGKHNFVDSDSRLMLDNGRNCFVQGYNAQIATDAHAQVIVAAEITQQVNDRQQLIPMVQAVWVSAGNKPEVITADAGYWDSSNLLDPLLNGIDVLVPPDSRPPLPGAELPDNAPKGPEATQMRERLGSESGKKLYEKRKSTVEPVFGQIKEARGFRRFRLRTLRKVVCEWKFICATHNLLKLFRHRFVSGPAEALAAA